MAICRRDVERLAQLRASMDTASRGPRIVQETRKFFIARYVGYGRRR
jgi:hypothetical protein